MHFGILTKYYQAADSIKTINKAEIQRWSILGKYPVVRDGEIFIEFPNENNNIFLYFYKVRYIYLSGRIILDIYFGLYRKENIVQV